MIHPEKWRDSIDPFELTIPNFKIERILGYPHAGNDVFQMEGLYEGELCRAFMKVERHQDANFANEVEVVRNLDYQLKPEILAYSLNAPVFIITKEIEGERLSTLLNEDPTLSSFQFLEKYGEALARLHSINVDCGEVKDRWSFHVRSQEYYVENDLCFLAEFLSNHKAENTSKCFVHGDFHYANVLWNHGEVSGVLDYELSGIGIREFDMAWAVFLRSSQKFLYTMEEVELFLKGYQKIAEYSPSAFWYYFALIAGHFYTFGDEEYEENVKRLINEAINRH